MLRMCEPWTVDSSTLRLAIVENGLRHASKKAASWLRSEFSILQARKLHHGFGANFLFYRQCSPVSSMPWVWSMPWTC